MYKHAFGQDTPSAGPNHSKLVDRMRMPVLPFSGPPPPPAPIIKQAKYWRRRKRTAATRIKEG